MSITSTISLWRAVHLNTMDLLPSSSSKTTRVTLVDYLLACLDTHLFVKLSSK